MPNAHDMFAVRAARKTDRENEKTTKLADLLEDFDEAVIAQFNKKGGDSDARLQDALALLEGRDNDLEMVVLKTDSGNNPGNALPAAGQSSMPFDNVGGYISILDASDQPTGNGFPSFEVAKDRGWSVLVTTTDPTTGEKRIKGVKRPEDIQVQQAAAQTTALPLGSANPHQNESTVDILDKNDKPTGEKILASVAADRARRKELIPVMNADGATAKGYRKARLVSRK